MDDALVYLILGVGYSVIVVTLYALLLNGLWWLYDKIVRKGR